jgi:aminomethyltransferase
MKIMSDATGGAIDEDMMYFHSGYYDVGGQQLYVSRTGWTGELGYEIYAEGASTDHKRLWDHVMEAGLPHGLIHGCMDSMGMRRIEAGILDNLTDFDVSMTPFEAGLGAFIDLDKEGFIGRDVLLEVDRETLLYGIKCSSLIPDTHFEILDDAACVGRVTTGAWSPFLDNGIGYARFEQSGDWAGRSLTLKNEQGKTASCEIVALPFYDSEKRIPRGMEKPIV